MSKLPDAPKPDAPLVIAPRIDRVVLTKAHALLCKLETELKATGRGEEADTLAYVDLVVLALRSRA